MSFKNFSTTQDTARNDKSKDAPAADQPAEQPEKTPAEVAPKPKS